MWPSGQMKGICISAGKSTNLEKFVCFKEVGRVCWSGIAGRSKRNNVKLPEYPRCWFWPSRKGKFSLLWSNNSFLWKRNCGKRSKQKSSISKSSEQQFWLTYAYMRIIIYFFRRRGLFCPNSWSEKWTFFQKRNHTALRNPPGRTEEWNCW